MKAGSVIVDVAIDQGGCCETSRPSLTELSNILPNAAKLTQA
jgi:alanine dehydrogenase